MNQEFDDRRLAEEIKEAAFELERSTPRRSRANGFLDETLERRASRQRLLASASIAIIALAALTTIRIFASASRSSQVRLADSVSLPDLAASPLQPGLCSPIPPKVELPAGVLVALELPKAEFSRGEPISLDLNVRNTGTRSIEYWQGGQRYDFWIIGPGGAWLWSQGKIFQDFLVQQTLGPSERIEVREFWQQIACNGQRGMTGQTVEPGLYRVAGLWVVSNSSGQSRSWWSNEVQFTVR